MNNFRTLINGHGTYISITIVSILVTAGISYGLMRGTVETRIEYIEVEAKKHTNKEVFDARMDEIIRRLERIEKKLDN